MKFNNILCSILNVLQVEPIKFKLLLICLCHRYKTSGRAVRVKFSGLRFVSDWAVLLD